VLYEPGMSCQLYFCVNLVHYVMVLLANKMMMMMMKAENVDEREREKRSSPSNSEISAHEIFRSLCYIYGPNQSAVSF